MDESLCRLPVSSFHCGERLEQNEDQPSVMVVFVCNLPKTYLEFACREPSCGALLPGETAVKQDVSHVDPNFFDAGYTLAGRTGFQVWTGTRFLLETLLWPNNTHDVDRLQYWQESLSNKNVLELGAGVGVVGISLASVGAHVLLTDLPTLVENAIEPNLIRNETTNAETKCPEWLSSYSNAVSINDGWAATTPVDWNQPVEHQLTEKQKCPIDLIVASDCVFLVSMLNSLLDTVAEIFTSSPNASLLLSFQRRDAQDGDESESFTTVNRVMKNVQARKWCMECLAWRPVVVGNDTSQVFVFEIRQLGQD